MIQAASTQEFKPEIVVLYCQYSVAKDADINAVQNRAQGFKARFMMLPCSSKIEVPHLLKILEKGVDGIQVIGCPDDLCRFLVGNQRAEKRIEYARGLLDQVGMGADRLSMQRGQGLSEDALLQIAQAAADTVRKMGPNPMKRGNK